MVQNSKVPYGPGQRRLAELRSARQAESPNPRDWTQVALARKVGASVRSVKAWESGQTVPRPFYRRRLAMVFGLAVTDLGF
jgi:DNA-binding XRE family transcriptional regulator